MNTWSAWSERRPPFHGTHLDSAAAGRSSTAVQRAVADHMLRESQRGPYVAEAEAAAVLAAGRGALAGLLGVPADGLAFVESASNALHALLTAWPLPPGATVAVVPAEWGPNLQVFAAHGLQVRELAADPTGRVDLDALDHLLRHDPPAVVQLDHVAAHRALVQPVAEAATLCRAAGVALWVDAAQALGHVDTATGADAFYATGRKWLAGPRGVGLLGVAPRWWEALRAEPRVLEPDRPIVQRLESGDAHIAGRVGLATAAAEHVACGPPQVWRRLDEVGRLSRAALADVPGWAVVAAPDGSGAITALRSTSGQDVVTVRARLLAEHGIVTTACLPVRAPGEMTEPYLRVSPHVDCDEPTLEQFRAALIAAGE